MILFGCCGCKIKAIYFDDDDDDAAAAAADTSPELSCRMDVGPLLFVLHIVPIVCSRILYSTKRNETTFVIALNIY